MNLDLQIHGARGIQVVSNGLQDRTPGTGAQPSIALRVARCKRRPTVMCVAHSNTRSPLELGPRHSHVL